MLKQDRNSPIEVELQVAIIFAVVNNLLRDVDTDKIRAFEKELFDYLKGSRQQILAAIRETGILDDDTAADLRAAIEHCKDKFVG